MPDSDDSKLVGTFRRFEYGPVFMVVDVHTKHGRKFAKIELPESGQTATLTLEQVLASPEA
jgi:hypothetical protein